MSVGQEFGTVSKGANPTKGSERKRPKAKGPEKVIDRSTMAAEYGYALKVIYSNTEIRNLFEQAVNDKTGLWTAAKFQSALRDTKWWRDNNEYARTAWAAEMLGTNPDGSKNADWQDQLNLAGQKVDEAATKIGARLDEAARQEMIHRYMYEGWSDPSRATLMADALAEKIGVSSGTARGSLMGMSGNLADDLKATASANGLHLSEDYYLAAAKSVARGLTTADDWTRDVRTQAASLWPTLADKINAGSDARSLASGYINTMAQTLELDPQSIDINDPLLRSAMTQVDDKGNAIQTGLWDFQQTLRNDPRWMNTKQATDSISSIATDVMRMFGLRG